MPTSSSFGAYVTVGLGGAALAAVAVDPGPLIAILPVLALIAMPVSTLLMVRSAMKAGHVAGAGGSHIPSKEKRLWALQARLQKVNAEQVALGIKIENLEAEYLPPSRVIIEAERIARAAAKRPPSSRP